LLWSSGITCRVARPAGVVTGMATCNAIWEK